MQNLVEVHGKLRSSGKLEKHPVVFDIDAIGQDVPEKDGVLSRAELKDLLLVVQSCHLGDLGVDQFRTQGRIEALRGQLTLMLFLEGSRDEGNPVETCFEFV